MPIYIIYYLQKVWNFMGAKCNPSWVPWRWRQRTHCIKFYNEHVPIFLFNFLWFLFLHQKVIGTMVQIKIKENLSYLNFCFPTLKFAVNAFMHTPACGSSSITTIGPWFFWRRSFRSLWFIFTLKNDKLMIRPIRYFFLVLYIFHHVQCLAKHSVFLPFMK